MNNDEPGEIINLDMEALLLTTQVRIGKMQAIQTDTGKLEGTGVTLKITGYGIDRVEKIYFFILDRNDLANIVEDLMDLGKAGVL